MFAQVFGSQGTRIEKHLRPFRDVAANVSMFGGSRPVTLFRFFKNIRTGFNKVYVSEVIALVMSGSLLSKNDGRLYKFILRLRERPDEPHSRYGFVALLQKYLQRYLTDSILTDSANRVTEIRQQPEEDDQNYGEHAEEYATECSSVYSDDMLVS